MGWLPLSGVINYSHGDFPYGYIHYVDFAFPPIETTAVLVSFLPSSRSWTGRVYGNDIEAYGSATPPPTDSLKIISPLPGSQFQLNEPISFIGEMTGTVTNVQWVSSINGVFANTLITNYAGLNTGTHTITLKGNDSGGNLISTSTTIAIKEPNPDVKILGLDFLSSAGLDNRNRLYDRKQTFKSAPVGQKLLEPTQWEGTMNPTNGVVTESFNWPVCYVRDSAPSLTGPSKIKLDVKVVDFKATSNPGPIEVEASGTIYGASGFQQSFEFSPTTFNTNSWPTSFTIESTTALPNFVGEFNLEISWCFKKSGQILSSQRTPKTGDFHKVYTTWEKPIDNQNFGIIEADPTTYLEIHTLSCQILNGFNSGKTADDVMSSLLNDYSTTGGFGYSTRVASTTDPRGLDAILSQTTIPKMGWCGELALLLKALIETHGIDVKVRKYWLKDVYFADYRLVTPHLAADNISPWPPATLWDFQDHATVITKTSPIQAFDPTFKEKDIFTTYVNSLFDVYQLPAIFVSNDPTPEYVGFQPPLPPSYSDYD